MTTRSALTHLLLTGTLLGGILLTGCAPTEEPEVGSTVTTSPSAPESLSPATPTTTPKPKPGGSGPSVPPPAKDIISVTGTVERLDIEGGCTVLRTDGRTFQLLGGDPKVIKPGATLTVRGRVRDDIMTVCQVGPVLEVLAAQPS